MSTADFKISASPSSDAGYDATAGEVLSFQLEASPALDFRRVVFSQVAKTKDAPDLVFSSSGVADPPTTIIQATVPAGVNSWLVRAQADGGKDAAGVVQPGYTRERIVCVRSVGGRRKILPSERTQYDATYGWTAAQNEDVELGPVDSVSVTAPITLGGTAADPVIGCNATVEDNAAALALRGAAGELVTKAEAVGEDSSIAGLHLWNASAATVGGDEWSPALVFSGEWWNGSSEPMSFTAQLQSNALGARLVFSSHPDGSPIDERLAVSQGGEVVATGENGPLTMVLATAGEASAPPVGVELRPHVAGVTTGVLAARVELLEIDLAEGDTVALELEVFGARVGGEAAGNIGDAFRYRRAGLFGRKSGGAVTLIGTFETMGTDVAEATTWAAPANQTLDATVGASSVSLGFTPKLDASVRVTAVARVARVAT